MEIFTKLWIQPSLKFWTQFPLRPFLLIILSFAAVSEIKAILNFIKKIDGQNLFSFGQYLL